MRVPHVFPMPCLLVPSLAVAVLTGACAAPDQPTAGAAAAPRPISNAAPSGPQAPAEVDITIASYNALDQLIENAAAPLSPQKPIVVTTLVNSGDLSQTSDLGRLISEQMASRLANAGYTVQELRLGAALKIREGTGELILTRDVRQLSRVTGAQAIIAGTYTQAHTRVFVTAKLIQPGDGRMLSAADFDLPLSRDVHSLLMPAPPPGSSSPMARDATPPGMRTYTIRPQAGD